MLLKLKSKKLTINLLWNIIQRKLKNKDWRLKKNSKMLVKPSKY